MPERKISIHNHVMPRVVTDRIRELASPDGGRGEKNHFLP